MKPSWTWNMYKKPLRNHEYDCQSHHSYYAISETLWCTALFSPNRFTVELLIYFNPPITTRHHWFNGCSLVDLPKAYVVECKIDRCACMYAGNLWLMFENAIWNLFPLHSAVQTKKLSTMLLLGLLVFFVLTEMAIFHVQRFESIWRRLPD